MHYHLSLLSVIFLKKITAISVWKSAKESFALPLPLMVQDIPPRDLTVFFFKVMHAGTELNNVLEMGKDCLSGVFI